MRYDFGYLRPELRGWKAQLNATNLFDHYYVASCIINLNYCGLGASRTVLLSLKYSWSEVPIANEPPRLTSLVRRP
jgi:iron complex outermembrane receptor protein